MQLYKGYKIVGLYPQFDVWELDPDTGEAKDLAEEWDRNQEPEEIQIWTYNAEDDYWAWDGDFDGLEFQNVIEARAVIDKFKEAKNKLTTD